MAGDLANQVQGSSGGGTTAKSKLNLYWSGRSYTFPVTQWIYFNKDYGPNAGLQGNEMLKNYNSSTLGKFDGTSSNIYPEGNHHGFTSPVDGKIKSIVFTFHIDITGTFQFGLIHGSINSETTSGEIPTTNVNIGNNGDDSTGNDTALEKITTSINHKYIVSNDNLNHDVNKGDMIMIACRRTNVDDGNNHNLYLTVNIIIEEN
jgi:hypothetical protein